MDDSLGCRASSLAAYSSITRSMLIVRVGPVPLYRFGFEIPLRVVEEIEISELVVVVAREVQIRQAVQRLLAGELALPHFLEEGRSCTRRHPDRLGGFGCPAP